MKKNLKFVVSPGFPPDHNVLINARARGHEIITEIDLALSHYKGQTIAVTGTNGKSTTVMMIDHLLQKLDIDHLTGGNIGIAASSLMTDPDHKFFVLELSSYQIEASSNIKPKIAVLTGIAPDHMQRHKDLDTYLATKWLLFKNQTPDDFALIHRDAFTRAMKIACPQPKSKIILVDDNSSETIASNLTNFRWDHDKLNAFFAVESVAKLTGKNPSEIALLLQNYKILPYRCEIIGYIDRWAVINDSKGTNVDSTLHALSNVPGKTTLLLGGMGKGESFEDILSFSR